MLSERLKCRLGTLGHVAPDERLRRELVSGEVDRWQRRFLVLCTRCSTNSTPWWDQRHRNCARRHVGSSSGPHQAWARWPSRAVAGGMLRTVHRDGGHHLRHPHLPGLPLPKAATTCTRCGATADVSDDRDHRPLWTRGWRWIGTQALFSRPPCQPVIVVTEDGRHQRGPGAAATRLIPVNPIATLPPARRRGRRPPRSHPPPHRALLPLHRRHHREDRPVLHPWVTAWCAGGDGERQGSRQRMSCGIAAFDIR